MIGQGFTSSSKEGYWKPRDAGMRNAGLDSTAASFYLAMVLTFGMCEFEATARPGLKG